MEEILEVQRLKDGAEQQKTETGSSQHCVARG